ncbi:MAG TPA: Rrf2 family transcriptional regulator [Rhodocyclaceae bacterium]|nr:Rrf2 family transcriptional regulator [Rhodocyclaceae bacterium]
MRLTAFSDYTLRVLIYLALNPERLVTIQAIAESYGISENHLMKVVHHLARTGLIETVRGKGGGMRLARPPAAIGLGEVIRSTESDGPIVECMGEANQCRITRSCALAGILTGAFDRFYAYLEAYTLADLIAKPQPLQRLLHIQSPPTTLPKPSLRATKSGSA